MPPALPSTTVHDAVAILNDSVHKSHLQVPPTNGKSPYTSGLSSVNSSDTSLHIIKNVPGYSTPVFTGKKQQQEKVLADVMSKVSPSFIPSVVVVVAVAVGCYFRAGSTNVDDTL